jgi:hypothetical protein
MKVQTKKRLAYALAASVIPFQASALNVSWTGATDSNWAIPGNWNGNNVPGTTTLANADLVGNNIEAVVATPFIAPLLNQVNISDGASLLIEESIQLQDSLKLGAIANSDGGSFYQHADISIATDIRLGHVSTVTSPSYYAADEGALTVAGQIFLRNGTFEVEGNESTISADNMRVLAGAELFFDFGVEGASPINLSGNLTINSGAKLTIDLRGYAIGGNTVELVNFSSLSGSFNANDITIIGLNGGSVNYTGTALTVSVVDEPQGPVHSMWVETKPDATDNASLSINTGSLIRDISSSDLSYTQNAVGNDLVYSVNWAGSDLDGDNNNDNISFDIRVKGYTGSSYVYSEIEGQSSAALGSSSVVSANPTLWGVGADSDLDAGESLSFSVENIALSASGYNANVEGFISFQLNEVSGHTHKLIIGEGNNLNSVVSNSPKDYSLNALDTFNVTSAGSGTATAPGIGAIGFKITIDDGSSSAVVMDSTDYSSYSSGPTFKGDYPAETDFSDYPEFSWNKVQRWSTINGTMSDDEAKIVAENHQVISLGGFQSESESVVEAALLKTHNANIKTLAYINTNIHFGYFEADSLYDVLNWSKFTLDETTGEPIYEMIRRFYTRSHEYPEMRDWWVDVAVDMAAEDEIDGIFIDKGHSNYEFINDDGVLEQPATGQDRAYYDLSQQIANDKIIISNSLRNEKVGGNRRTMNIFTGSYMERWDLPHSDPIAQSVAEAKAVSIELMREAALKGKILLPALHDRLTDDEINAYLDIGDVAGFVAKIKEKLQVELAYYLIMAERYTYFRFQPDQDVDKFPEVVWDPTAYLEELTRPLGEPFGAPVRDGYNYTRSFEYVDVELNIETDVADLTWYDAPEGHYKFQNSNAQEELNGHKATTSNVTIVNAVDGKGLEFNGVDSDVTLPASLFANVNDEVSIAVWVYGDDTQPQSETLFQAINADGDRMLNINLPWSNSRVYWDAGHNGSNYDRTWKLASTQEIKNQWNHWVFTKNANTGEMRIYLNGNIWHEATGKTHSMSGITNATFGSGNGVSFFTGKVDDLRVYSHAMTDTEVARLFNRY